MFKTRDLVLPAVLVLAVILLGVWGLSICEPAVCGESTLFNRLAVLANLFNPRVVGGLHPEQFPLPLKVAQYLGPWVLVLGTLIATFQVTLRNLRHDVRLMLASKRRDHTIVCGLGDTGMQVIQNLVEAGQQVVAIDRDADTLNAKVCEQGGVPVLNGDGTDEGVLKLSGLARARAVVLCTGDDARNIDIALRIRDWSGRRRPAPSSLCVSAEMRMEWLFSKLIDHDKEPLNTSGFELRLFNIYENAARLLISSLDPQSAAHDSDRPIIIVGFGAMGREIALHVLRAAPVALTRKTRMKIFDQAGERRRHSFFAAFPAIPEVGDVEFVTAEFSPALPETWAIVENEIREGVPLAIVVCLEDEEINLYAALGFRSLLDELRQEAVPVHARFKRYRRLGQFAADIERMHGRSDRIHIFGALEDLLSPAVLFSTGIDILAEAVHLEYLTISGMRGNVAADRPWSRLPETLKMSNRRFADHIAIKLAQAGLHVVQTKRPQLFDLSSHEIELFARLEHRRWFIDRRLLGWRYGEDLDDLRRAHPYLVRWEDLPPAIQQKNRDLVSTVPRVLANVGMEIRRAGDRSSRDGLKNQATGSGRILHGQPSCPLSVRHRVGDSSLYSQ